MDPVVKPASYSDLKTAFDNFDALQATDVNNLIAQNGRLVVVWRRRVELDPAVRTVIAQTFESLRDLPNWIRKPSRSENADLNVEQRIALCAWFMRIQLSEVTRGPSTDDRFQKALQSIGMVDHASLTDELTPPQVQRMVTPPKVRIMAELTEEHVLKVLGYCAVKDVEQIPCLTKSLGAWNILLWKEYCASQQHAQVDWFRRAIEDSKPRRSDKERLWHELAIRLPKGMQPIQGKVISTHKILPNAGDTLALADGRTITLENNGRVQLWSVDGELIKTAQPTLSNFSPDTVEVILLPNGCIACSNRYQDNDVGNDNRDRPDSWDFWDPDLRSSFRFSDPEYPVVFGHPHPLIGNRYVMTFYSYQKMTGSLQIRSSEGELLTVCETGMDTAGQIRVLADGKFATCHESDIKIWDSHNGTLVTRLPNGGSSQSIDCIENLPDGRIAYYQAKAIRIWNPVDDSLYAFRPMEHVAQGHLLTYLSDGCLALDYNI